ncbi:hypothetical protein MBLNU230_g4146t1 [Neophaeotheca triangularis]
MERPGSPAKPSGIPRPGGSRLPTLKKPSSQLPTPKPKREDVSDTTRPTPRQPALQKRTSTSSFKSSQTTPKDAVATAQAFQRRGYALASKPSLNLKTAAPTSKPAPLRPTSRGNRAQLPALIKSNSTTEDEENHDRLASLDSFRSASRLGSRDGQPDSPEEYVEPEPIATPKPRKSSRPSLSDRTMDSLSSLPTTPRDRRRSSFFSPLESPMGGPMGPPPRPSSSLSRNQGSGNSRPGTSDGSFSKPTGRPSSPSKRTSMSAKPTARTSLGGFGFTPGTGGRRSISAAYGTRPESAKESVPPMPTAASPSKTPRPTGLPSGKTPSKIGTGSKTFGARPAKPCPALGGAFAKPPQSRPEFNAGPDEKPVAVKPLQNSKRPSEAKPTPSSPVPSSSAALRQQIAAAKAAARSAKQKHDSTQDMPTESVGTYNYDLAVDPFNQAPKDPNHILRNRINSARMDGKLNISAMSLQDIPAEVLKMYDSTTLNESKVHWAEVVDLTRLNIANNELEQLPLHAFPDISTEDLISAGDEDDNEDANSQATQFRGLEVLDAHNNKLVSLPRGLRHLTNLTRLDLAHNKLDNSTLETLAQVGNLKELKLAHNQLAGNFPPTFCRQLPRLEILDLQSNRLLALPEALRDLGSLRVLNVSGNQLTSLPMEALNALPLTELDANSNALIGPLFPLNCESAHRTLKTLNVANNSLAALTFGEKLELPALQHLDVSNNHLAALPAVGDWRALTTLMAGENKISEVPEGFVGLSGLRNVNFASNDLRLLKSEVGRMEGLVSLVVSGNPLRERRFLTMGVEEIKRDLRRKLEPAEGGAEEESEALEEGQPATVDAVVEPAKWTLKPNRTLDLFNHGLTDEDLQTSLHDFLAANEVRHLLLAHNNLTTIPTNELKPVAPSLQSLDLSSNPFITTTTNNNTPSDPLSLPHLKSLTLTHTPLHTLTLLTHTLHLPSLSSLNLSSTRLSGPLPAYTTLYRNLQTLILRHNAYTSLTPDDVRGAQTLDLRDNALEALPPALGLLGLEHGGLRRLEVGGNRFRVPGGRVLEQGSEAVLRWLRGRVEGFVEEE